MDKLQYKRKDKTMHIVEYFYTSKLVEPLLPILSKTFITPNMITLFNSFFALVILYFGYNKRYFSVAIFIQIYLFLDILDGNLARYKNMKSELGAKLDSINDRFFYTLIFVFIGIKNIQLPLIILVVVLINIYGIIATYYIVPRLRKMNVIKRWGIKKYFMDKGFIIGMDLGTIDIITSVFLIFGKIKLLYIVLIIGLVLDIVYRLIELWYNMKLNDCIL